MPQVVNGIGTWYYGKRRIHRLRATCGFCKRVADLESFDTTLYFVVLMIPLIPLSRKRVLQKCPHCTRHQIVSLAKWEKTKSEDIDRMLAKLREDPDDPVTVRAALALAQAYQDQELFDKLAPALAEERVEDPDIQTQLGRTYAYFGRWSEAERSYRLVLRVKDDAAARAQLGFALLKQLRPDDAAPFLESIIKDKNQESAGMIYLLIEAYQALGRHEEALEWINRRDAAFPQLATGKPYIKQKRVSEKNLSTGKPVQPMGLGDSGRAAYEEGNWKARVPRWIGPIVILSVLAWYLGTALYLGRAHKVYWVNGWHKAYKITINGEEHELKPGATPLAVPEGDLKIVFADRDLQAEPMQCRLESPFFSRPFSSTAYIVNPDRIAIISERQIVYAERHPPNEVMPRPKYYTGALYRKIDHVDYPFEPSPPTISVPHNGHIIKTQVAALGEVPPETRLRLAEKLGSQGQIDYAAQLLRFDPGDVAILNWLVSHVKPEQALAVLEQGLDRRPIALEWHRSYQTLVERRHPDRDLVPTYQKLLRENPDDPSAMYLLARLMNDDLPAGDRLLQAASTATPPCAYAWLARSFRAGCAGRFDEAVKLSEKAVQLAPGNATILHGRRRVLWNALRYDRLGELLRADTQASPTNETLWGELVLLQTIQGGRAAGTAAREQALAHFKEREFDAVRNTLQHALDINLAFALHDIPGSLKALAVLEQPSPLDLKPPSFYAFFLQNRYEEASHAIDANPDLAAVQRALLYLAAVLKEKGPGNEQWSAFQQELKNTGGAMRVLAGMLQGGKPPDANRLYELPIDPGYKSILLTAIARHFPETEKRLNPLAKSLDSYPDMMSLCLYSVRN
jgi:tetratricopeptide (TPR) repeat protein